MNKQRRKHFNKLLSQLRLAIPLKSGPAPKFGVETIQSFLTVAASNLGYYDLAEAISGGKHDKFAGHLVDELKHQWNYIKQAHDDPEKFKRALTKSVSELVALYSALSGKTGAERIKDPKRAVDSILVRLFQSLGLQLSSHEKIVAASSDSKLSRRIIRLAKKLMASSLPSKVSYLPDRTFDKLRELYIHELGNKAEDTPVALQKFYDESIKGSRIQTLEEFVTAIDKLYRSEIFEGGKSTAKSSEPEAEHRLNHYEYTVTSYLYQEVVDGYDYVTANTLFREIGLPNKMKPIYGLQYRPTSGKSGKWTMNIPVALGPETKDLHAVWEVHPFVGGLAAYVPKTRPLGKDAKEFEQTYFFANDPSAKAWIKELDDLVTDAIMDGRITEKNL